MRLLSVIGLVLALWRPAAASPAHLTPRLIKVEVVGSATLVTLAAGSEQGVTKDARAYLIDANEHRISGGELRIIRVDKRQTIARCDLMRDQLSSHVRAEVVLP